MINTNIPKQNIDALRIITKKFLGKYISWTLTGSTSLAIQNVNIKANDIDILTDIENADKIVEILKEYLVEPMHHKTGENFRSYYGMLKIADVKVEIMAELEIKYNDRWIKREKPRIKLIKRFEDMTLPLLELQEEYEAYNLMGRSEKTEKILEAIEKERLSTRRSSAS